MDAFGDWRGSGKRGRSWGIWLSVSALLHVPLTPLAVLLGLFGLLRNPNDDLAPAPAVQAIPIDLLEEAAPDPAPAPEAPPEPAAPPTVAEPVAERPRTPKIDAGVPPDAGAAGAPSEDAGPKDAGVDAAMPDAGPPDAGPPLAGLDAGVPDAGPGEADAGPNLRNPVIVSGADRVVDENANVQLLIDTEKVRAHAIGPRIGSMLTRLYQWRDFLGPTGIDPVRDFDRILIVGSQFRDSSGVIAVIQHRVKKQTLHDAIDTLVRRDTETGAWLPGDVPVAQAQADRALRFFVQPARGVLIITHKEALKNVRGFRGRLPALPGDEVGLAKLNSPHRAFRGTLLTVPESIRAGRARVAALPDGGAVVDIDAEDASEELAQRNAARLAQDISALAELAMLESIITGGPGRYVERIEFHAEGSRILGRLTFTPRQILALLRKVEERVAPRSAPSARPVPALGQGGAPAPPAPTRRSPAAAGTTTSSP